MLDKASAIEERVAELERKLSDPATLGNQREYARLAKERSQLSEAAQCAREYIRIADEIAGHKSILDGNDADLRELAKAEMPTLQKNLEAVEEKLKELLTPRDPNDERTLSSKFARAPAVKRPRCLPATCSGCTRATPNATVSSSKRSASATPGLAG